jgi:uncharacterized repeat protein (TIGR04138 family)
MNTDPLRKINDLLEQDRRYKFEAYAFVFEALSYAQNVLGYGVEQEGESLEHNEFSFDAHDEDDDDEEDSDVDIERHVSGQQLCEAIRLYALEQFGYMTKIVLNSWGVRKTSDFGEIVFNLLEIEQMRKTPHDRREDFDDVYDFDDVFLRDFRIHIAG